MNKKIEWLPVVEVHRGITIWKFNEAEYVMRLGTQDVFSKSLQFMRQVINEYWALRAN